MRHRGHRGTSPRSMSRRWRSVCILRPQCGQTTAVAGSNRASAQMGRATAPWGTASLCTWARCA
eukprot:1707145-Lingulodinium_polyedra.AAC.1